MLYSVRLYSSMWKIGLSDIILLVRVAGELPALHERQFIIKEAQPVSNVHTNYYQISWSSFC